MIENNFVKHSWISKTGDILVCVCSFVLFSPGLAFNIGPNLTPKYYFASYLGHAYSNNKDFPPWHCRKLGKQRSIERTKIFKARGCTRSRPLTEFLAWRSVKGTNWPLANSSPWGLKEFLPVQKLKAVLFSLGSKAGKRCQWELLLPLGSSQECREMPIVPNGSPVRTGWRRMADRKKCGW